MGPDLVSLSGDCMVRTVPARRLAPSWPVPQSALRLVSRQMYRDPPPPQFWPLEEGAVGSPLS